VYERIDVAVKGSLLHDIGKIVYRNDPEDGNHSNAGANFIQEDSVKMQNKEEVLECIRYHHKHSLSGASISNGSMAYIVYEANNIASGIDRSLIYEGTDEQSFDEKLPLHSVFNQLNTHKNGNVGAYPVKPRFLEDSIHIPDKDIESLRSNITQGSYGEVLSIIQKNLREMDGVLDSPNSLLKLLEATTSGIPSSASKKEIPDISIYDHSKITCALTSCMYIYSEDNGIRDYKDKFFQSREFRKEKAFLLVSGDISGIQDFIYTIASKGALRSLRGRSLYLEIMTETLVDDILEKFSLTRANLIYSGGGHFYLLLPNTEKARNEIRNIKSEINKKLLEMYSISLYLEMDYQECSADELGNGLDRKENKENLLGEVFAGVSRKISENKIQRYKGDYLEELLDPDSDFNKKTQHERECVICGESDDLIPFQKNDDVLACRSCDGLATLGSKIANIYNSDKDQLIVVKKEDHGGIRLPSLGEDKYLDIEPLEKVEQNLKMGEGKYTSIFSINEPMMGMACSTNLWIGNYNKRIESRAIEFEELAKKSTGIKRLGILRADVDDLGKEGRYDNITFSRTATFSREMTMFFKYEINRLLNGVGDGQFSFRLPGNSKDLTGEEKNIVIVYSGGDDVFAVGPWDEILEFSVNLNDAFKEYSLGRLSISAGIGMFPKGYPISQMAIKTGELEEAAKKNNNDNKDSVALFDYIQKDNVFTWSDFKDGVCLDKMAKLNSWFYFNQEEGDQNREKIYAGSSVLYRIYSLFKGEGNINIARLAYQLGRLKPSSKQQIKMETYENLKKTMYQWILDEKERKSASMAINLVILLNRTEKGD